MVMKATELRIGNWVSAWNSGIECQITVITNSTIGMPKPIPLTEEWLGKLGFGKGKSMWQTEREAWLLPKEDYKNNHEFWEFHLGDYPATNPNCGILRGRSEQFECPAIPKDLYDKEEWTKEDQKRCDGYTETIKADCHNVAHHIKYVHQLQNLIFALTGEELTINSPKLQENGRNSN